MTWRDWLVKFKGMKFDVVNVGGILTLLGININSVSMDAVQVQVAEIAKQLQGVVDSDGLVSAIILAVMAWHNGGRK